MAAACGLNDGRWSGLKYWEWVVDIARAKQQAGRHAWLILAVVITACTLNGCSRKGGGIDYTYDIQSTGCCTLVAHAGGDIDGNPYTDSREALLLSIRNGFHLVELDFVKTRNGDWFIAHDWKEWALLTGYHGELPPTTQSVESLKDQLKVDHSGYSIPGTYTTISLDDLVRILEGHPDVKIITDTHSLEEAMELIRVLKGTRVFKQFVFQVYSIGELKRAASVVPEHQLILTAYLMRDWYAPDGFGAAILSRLQKYPHLFALTIPMSTASQRAKMKRLRHALSVPILVHGNPPFINNRNLHLQLSDWGVNGIYVD
jgi:glycerophosphoryl diester phosphodiesterase